MAREIRAIPTLFGEDALRFERLAAEAERNAVQHDNDEQMKMVEVFLRKQNW